MLRRAAKIRMEKGTSDSKSMRKYAQATLTQCFDHRWDAKEGGFLVSEGSRYVGLGAVGHLPMPRSESARMRKALVHGGDGQTRYQSNCPIAASSESKSNEEL